MLEVSGIYKKFKKRQILNGASFTAVPGQALPGATDAEKRRFYQFWRG